MNWKKVSAFLSREADLARDRASALEISGNKPEAMRRALDKADLCYTLARAIEIGLSDDNG